MLQIRNTENGNNSEKKVFPAKHTVPPSLMTCITQVILKGVMPVKQDWFMRCCTLVEQVLHWPVWSCLRQDRGLKK